MDAKKRNIIIAVVVIICLAFGGFMYYKRTPTYTFNLIRESVQKHDYEAFSRHVDTRSLVSAAYDDIIKQGLAEVGDDESVKELASSFAQMLKPGVVDALDNQVTQYVKTGDIEKKNQKPTDVEKAADGMVREMNLMKTTFKGVGKTRKEDGFSYVGIILHDKKVGQDFTLELQMKQLDDGTWKVLKINNLGEYLKAYQAAEEKKLAEINAPIQADIDHILQAGKVTGKLVSKDRWGIQRLLLVTMDVTIDSETKAISEVTGTVKLTKDKDVLEKKFRANIKNNSKRIVVSFDLNPFLSKEERLLKSGVGGYSFEAAFTGIHFADGTSLELKKFLN
jgi:hypothetical protein